MAIPLLQASERPAALSCLPLRGRGTADAASAVDEVFQRDVTSFQNGQSRAPVPTTMCRSVGALSCLPQRGKVAATKEQTDEVFGCNVTFV